MVSEVAELLHAITGEGKSEMKIVIGEAVSSDPLQVHIGGAGVFDIRINADIRPGTGIQAGDKLLCILTEGMTYVLCRLEE